MIKTTPTYDSDIWYDRYCAAISEHDTVKDFILTTIQQSFDVIKNLAPPHKRLDYEGYDAIYWPSRDHETDIHIYYEDDKIIAYDIPKYHPVLKTLPDNFPYFVRMTTENVKSKIKTREDTGYGTELYLDYDMNTIIRTENNTASSHITTAPEGDSIIFTSDANYYYSFGQQKRFQDDWFGLNVRHKIYQCHSTEGPTKVEIDPLAGEVTSRTFHFNGHDCSEWVNKKGWAAPFTEKQIYELELKYR